MDSGNYQYSQYETAAGYGSGTNAFSSGQPQSQSMMTQQTGMFTQPSMMGQQMGSMPQQTGMMSQQSSMSQQWGTMSDQTGTLSHQTGTMSQQTGSMAQQSGTMSQQSGAMYQQSGSWCNTNSNDMQQSNYSWSESNNQNYSQQGMGNFNNPPESYSTVQQSDNSGCELYFTGTQQYSNNPQQQMSGFSAQQLQDGGNSMNYNSGSSSFQGTDSGFQQGNNFGYQSNSMYGEGNSFGYQENNYRNENVPAFQQSGQNAMHQQGNVGTHYQGGNMSSANQQGSGYQQGNNTSFQQQGQTSMQFQGSNTSTNQQGSGYQQGNKASFQQQGQTSMQFQGGNSSANQQGSGYQQGNRASFKPNVRNTGGMNDSLKEFYSEIGDVADSAGSDFQPQSFPRSGFDQQSNQVSSTQNSNMQHSMRQKPPAARNQTGTVKQDMAKGGDANKQFFTQEPDSSTPGHSAQSKNSEFADEDTEYCKLCNVYFTSAPLYALHVRGLAHSQRLMAVEAGEDRKAVQTPYILSGKNYTQTVPQESANIGQQNAGEQQKEQGSSETALNAGCYCEICDIYVNSERMLWRHYQGKKHLKALKAVQQGELQMKPASERPVDPNIQKASELMASQIPEDEVSAMNSAFDSAAGNEPVVGLGFLVETMEKMNQVIECELCKTKGNLYNMVQHVLGLKHRLQYLKVRDRARYDSVNKTSKKQVQMEEVRRLCQELESMEGRGTARYSGPPRKVAKEQERRSLGRAVTPPPAHLLRYREQQSLMSASEKRLAIEALKRTLLEDFTKRNIDPDTATTVLNSRMELLEEYEKRGVPFAVARERVIEEEERWNLLLEFERQVLSFDEAEQRIDHRFELLKMYEKNGFEREEARRKVLDDEVIYDFRRDFVRLGLQKAQAHKLAEKRLWMLEHLHFQGLTPENASKIIIGIEQNLRRFLRAMFEADKRGRARESQRAQWMIAGEELEKYVVQSSKDLSLSSNVVEEQVNLALEAFDRYRRHRIPADEAMCRVLVDDLPIPRQQSESIPVETQGDNDDPGSQADITNRVQQFKSKLNSVIQTAVESSDRDKEKEIEKEAEVVDQEKQLADYDQQSRTEIQNLLADMLKMKVPADEARKRLVALYKQHENLRENLFPNKKLANTSGKTDKSNISAESKTAEKPTVMTDDKSSKESQPLSKKNESPRKETRSAEEEKDHKEKTSEEAIQSQMSTEEEKPECPDNRLPGDTPGKSPETMKETSANDRWSASVEMFLQQYGLSKEEYRSQMSKRRSTGQDRYSPSDLSPRRSRSKSRDQSDRSPAYGEERSPVSRDRDSNRGEKRRRSRSRSVSSRWSKMFKSRLRSKSPFDRHRAFSPRHRSRQRSRSRSRSIERDWGGRGSRRSPGRRSPRRRFSGRRSPFSRSRFSPGRRTPTRRRSPFGRRSPINRRSPGRWSPPYNRGHSPGQGWDCPPDFDQYPFPGFRPEHPRSGDRYDSPYEFGSPEMERVREPLNRRSGPRWNRPRSQMREPEFNFAEGVWPDADDPWN